MSSKLLNLLFTVCAVLGCHKPMLNAEDYFDGPARELAVAIQRNQLDKARTSVGQVDLNRAYRPNLLVWVGLIFCCLH